MPEKRKSPTRLFTERMEREGRGIEFRDRVRARMVAEGKDWNQVSSHVMYEMGYLGPKYERELENLRLARQEAATKRTIEETLCGQVLAEASLSAFEDAVATLPPTANPDVEVEWVRAHPAMSRLNRLPEGTTRVEITAEDVLLVSHGKAPSRSAVNLLCDAASRPDKFWDKWLAGKRKTDPAAVGAAQTVADDGLVSVRDYLGQLKTGVKADGWRDE